MAVQISVQEEDNLFWDDLFVIVGRTPGLLVSCRDPEDTASDRTSLLAQIRRALILMVLAMNSIRQNLVTLEVTGRVR